MTIYWLDRVDSTQQYVLETIKTGRLSPPFAVVADEQFEGRGSRGNSWTGIKGNLFFSFAVECSQLPHDLKLESCSIYFAFLLKEVLCGFGSEVWLKWPNDFYVGDKKIGGTITTLRRDALVCGIGLNLAESPESFGVLDIKISRKQLLESYFVEIEKFPEWKEIFRLYALEFDKSRHYQTHNDDYKFSLENALLCEDGSIVCDGQRMYSQR